MQLKEDLKGLNYTKGAGPTDVTFSSWKARREKQNKAQENQSVNWVSGGKHADFNDRQF